MRSVGGRTAATSSHSFDRFFSCSVLVVRDRGRVCARAAMREELLGMASRPSSRIAPLFLSHELGFDLGLEGERNHPAGRNRSVVWSATFASVEDYETYDASEDHEAVVSDLIKPIIVPGSRAAIQHRSRARSGHDRYESDARTTSSSRRAIGTRPRRSAWCCTRGRPPYRPFGRTCDSSS